MTHPEFPPLTTILWAEGLTKTYAHTRTPALASFSLSMEPGEIVGLLGPNGAGKTTAISLLTGLLAPDSGSVHICGADLSKNPRKARQWIGLVPQHIALYPSLTAAENLSYFGRMYRINGRELKERVNACLEFVGLSNSAHGRIAAFSGGMQRRANLAVALLHQPRLLFLDEPTAGVDPQSRNMILDRLSELSRSGVSMLYTTHYIEEAEKICSRIAVIDEGRTIAQGSPGELTQAHPDCNDLGQLFLRLTGKDLRD
ncbi:MAG: ABC transporter ATP-binding protein [Deltaproteobacteria bacterium]|nr:ABC transporter ATP-binding protein [Deltaproteobacteria bacterium]